MCRYPWCAPLPGLIDGQSNDVETDERLINAERGTLIIADDHGEQSSTSADRVAELPPLIR